MKLLFLLITFISVSAMADEILAKDKRLALFDKFVSEIERIDGEGLLARKNRPEAWKATVSKLRSQMELAETKVDMGQVFRKLDATYPNLHAKIVLQEEYDLTKGHVRAVIGARFGAEIIEKNQKKYKYKISSVESHMFSETDKTNFPMVGDEIISINRRLMSEWHRENFIYCKFPLETQCAAVLYDNFRKGLLDWDWRKTLEYVLRRGQRTWAVSIPFLIPAEGSHQAHPHRVTDHCLDEQSRYGDFSVAYKGLNICVFESKKSPGVVVLRLASFAYREIPDEEKIKTLQQEVDQFYEAFWKGRAKTTKKLIIDLLDNGGGDTPVAWYEILLLKPFQEMYTQFRKVAELDDPAIRTELFYDDQEKEIWFQELKKSGTYDRIKNGEFLPPVPQFCATPKANCNKGLFTPRDHGFRGQIRLMTNEWCVSSCTGFVWNLKGQLKERVKVVGMPESGDSAYARLYLDAVIDAKAADGFSLAVSPRKGRTKQKLPDQAVFRQQVTATRSTNAGGKIISATPMKVDLWIPWRFRHFDEPWENKAFAAALKK